MLGGVTMPEFNPDRVVLANGEIDAAAFNGRARHLACQKAHIRDQKMSEQSSEQINIDGAIGEMAFGKRSNTFPDFTTEVRAGGVDITLNDQTTVDVKLSRLDRYITVLIHRSKSIANSATYFVFGNLDGNVVQFLGYIEAEIALTEKFIQTKKGKPAFCIPKSILKPLSELLER
jgi:hypothetical protein